MGKYKGKYKISDLAYQQHERFCKRYNELKTELRNPSNTEQRAEQLKNRLSMIEQTAIEAAGGDYQALLHNITTGISYDQMAACGIIIEGGGRNYFYEELRRKFFWLLEFK